MVAEVSVDVITLILLLTLFHVIYDGLLLVEGVCSHQDGGFLTGVGQAEEGDLVDEKILCCRQDKPEVAVMDPSGGALD